MNNFTIGITTFELRFDMLKNLIESIRKYCNEDIIVTVNGNHNKPLDPVYRKESLSFFSSIDNVYPIYFTEMRGLGKMINTIFIHSKNENVLILNDDLKITDKIFFDELEVAFNNLQNLCKLQTTWYSSFSHYIAKKSFIQEIGYYDERFLGFGEEDGDLSYRYIEKFGTEIPALSINGLEHYNSEIRQDIKPGVGKYSLFNREFINKKYSFLNGTIQGMFDKPASVALPLSEQYVYEKFFNENKVNL